MSVSSTLTFSSGFGDLPLQDELWHPEAGRGVLQIPSRMHVVGLMRAKAGAEGRTLVYTELVMSKLSRISIALKVACFK